MTELTLPAQKLSLYVFTYAVSKTGQALLPLPSPSFHPLPHPHRPQETHHLLFALRKVRLHTRPRVRDIHNRSDGGRAHLRDVEQLLALVRGNLPPPRRDAERVKAGNAPVVRHERDVHHRDAVPPEEGGFVEVVETGGDFVARRRGADPDLAATERLGVRRSLRSVCLGVWGINMSQSAGK